MRTESPFAHAYAVVMAGGSGTRFWPLSRRNRPKQLLDLFGRRTLVEQAVARIRNVLPPDRIYVFTNEWVRDQIRRRLPELPSAQIVAEPAMRNTAPTLGLAAHEILRRDAEGLMVVLAADHIIAKTGPFLRILRVACRWAKSPGRSMVLGIKPTAPLTGYGYVRLGREAGRLEGHPIRCVKKFTEKPSLKTARAYLASGEYLWNSGMFVWRADTLLRNLEQFQPRMAGLLARIAAAGGVRARRTLRALFPQCEKISIDYALMEKISNVYAIPADIGWSDVGSWAVAYELHPKDKNANVRPGDSLALDSRGNMIVTTGKKMVVTIGVRDLVIADTRDALLVCARERSQDVGKAVQELERRGLHKLL
jgi:mannose-1-phosphate guanylyltransferase